MTRQDSLVGILLFTLITSAALLACGDDEPGPAGPGEACDDNCVEGLVCADDGSGQNTCQIAAGDACDPDDETPLCLFGTACVEIVPADAGTGAGTGAEPAGACLIPEGGVCDATLPDPFCSPALVCAEQVDGLDACWPPLFFRGEVFDAQTTDAIEGAHVIALDDESVAVTDVAISDVDGSYELAIPALRETTGHPAPATYTLRSSAADYQTFPGGVRTALPIEASDAVRDNDDGPLVIDSALTDIALIALPQAQQGRPIVTGSVLSDEGAGVLVAAQGVETFTAVSDQSGDYTIFNVAPGSYTVSGYAAGLQLVPVDVSIDDEDVEDVDLVETDDGVVDVSGSLQTVNVSGSPPTTVVLALESTFDEGFGRGEVPRGLRAPLTGPPSVTGTFTIAGVPAGDYVVLAAFENDELVRDPDTNIAGTDTLRLEVPAGGGPIEIAESFKVTEALCVVEPGAQQPEVVTDAPTLEWCDDSSEQWYTVEVYDAFGNRVWNDDDVPSVSGGDTVTLQYEGPLEPGMFYQFRATSWRAPGGQDAAPISMTEDLRGVFQAAP